jgi:hypothetical protein
MAADGGQVDDRPEGPPPRRRGDPGRVVSRSGLDLAASWLMHVNRNYVFQGGSIDVRQFFRIET